MRESDRHDRRPGPAAAPATLLAAERAARERWRLLALRLRSVTPAGLARLLLAFGAIGAIAWLAWSYRAALIPFAVGLALAYLTAPLVNGLGRVFPRWLAVLLVVVGELALIIALGALLLPPLIEQLGRLLQALPTGQRLRALTQELASYARGLPEPSRELLRAGVADAIEALRANMDGSLRALLRLSLFSAGALLNTLGLVLSFIALPAWLMAVLRDQRRGLRALDRHLPPWLRADFWAMVRIVDRVLSAFVQGQLLIGLAVGLFTYGGLVLMARFGWLDLNYKLLYALLAGLLALVPTLGATLIAVVALLLGLAASWQTSLRLVLLAIAVQLLVNQLVVPHVERRYGGNLHPAVLVVAIILVSQFGPLWLLLAGPLLVIGVDLFRYLYGRVSDPPRPAGLLPGELLPAPVAPTRLRRRRLWPGRAPTAAAPMTPAPALMEHGHG